MLGILVFVFTALCDFSGIAMMILFIVGLLGAIDLLQVSAVDCFVAAGAGLAGMLVFGVAAILSGMRLAEQARSSFDRIR